MQVLIAYACPHCGALSEALYDDGERQYGDLPDCKNRLCAVPYAVMDAIATWLDDLAMSGYGWPVKPTRADMCGYDLVDR